MAVPEQKLPASRKYISSCGDTEDDKEAGLCEQRRMADAAMWQLGVNAVGVGLLLLTFGSTAWAAWAAGNAAGAANRSAMEAEKAAVLMQETAARQLRAYVGVDNIGLEFPNLLSAEYTPASDEPGRVFNDLVVISITNFGKTPAFEVDYWMNDVIVGRADTVPLPDDFPFPEPAPETWRHRPFTSMFVVWPGQTLIQKAACPDISSFRRARAGNGTLYIYGRVRFTDMQGARWRSRFCYAYEPFRPEGEQFVAYRMHNDWRRIHESPAPEAPNPHPPQAAPEHPVPPQSPHAELRATPE